MPVTTNILQRTFYIRYQNNTGTCFTVTIDGEFYLITARHIVQEIKDEDFVSIYHERNWKTLDVKLVGHTSNNKDITVLAPAISFGHAHDLVITTVEMTLSEDVYFLGYPFNITTDDKGINAGFPVPFVKKAIVSAFEDKMLYLDGHNNPGFSGGPVVRADKPDQVIGVISGYASAHEPVFTNDGETTPYYTETNTGIIQASDSSLILEILRGSQTASASSPEDAE